MGVIHRSLRAPEAEERALVLRAMDIEHQLERAIVGWRIVVPEYEEERAREQWRLYDLENRATLSSHLLMGQDRVVREGAVAGTVCWALVLLAVFILQSRHQFGIDWVGAGRLDVAAVRAGEWWRAITALTLHVDAPHLVANIVFGAVFGTLLAREIGAGLAWLVILVGGVAGNLMNAVVQRPSHTSIGASTAVFAALGLLAAYLWSGRRLIRNSWARRLSPVVGAVVMLAWFGTGDERTDIVAHLTGFLSGFAIGAVIGRSFNPQWAGTGRQSLFAVVTVFCLCLAWGFAL